MGLEQRPLSLVSTTEELLERKSSGCSLENQDYVCRGFIALTKWHPLSPKADTNFIDEWRLLGRYSSSAEYGHWGLLYHNIRLEPYKACVHRQFQLIQEPKQVQHL
jgi:hypothetical protein